MSSDNTKTPNTARTVRVTDGWCASEVRVGCELCGAEVYARVLCEECEAYIGATRYIIVEE